MSLADCYLYGDNLVFYALYHSKVARAF